MKNHLPIELITSNILTKLPVKSILQFRCVSKTWCSLIDHPSFNTTCSFLVIPHPSKGFYHVAKDEASSSSSLWDEGSKIYYPFKFQRSTRPYKTRLQLVGCCNGLLCLSSSFYDKKDSGTNYHHFIYIYNPATRQYDTLPPIPVPNPHRGSAYGFGFDPSTSKFKVVYLDDWNNNAHVYTLGSLNYSSSWRSLRTPSLNVMWWPMGVFLNGSVHWLITNNNPVISIAAFQIGPETMCPIPTPHLNENKHGQIKIGALGGCLCLSDCTLDDRYEIWVMKDYNVGESWLKQFVIGKPIMDETPVHAICPVSFRMNGELVLCCDNVFLASYNFETGKATPLQDYMPYELQMLFQGLRTPPLCCDAFPYVESVVSP